MSWANACQTTRARYSNFRTHRHKMPTTVTRVNIQIDAVEWVVSVGKSYKSAGRCCHFHAIFTPPLRSHQVRTHQGSSDLLDVAFIWNLFIHICSRSAVVCFAWLLHLPFFFCYNIFFLLLGRDDFINTWKYFISFFLLLHLLHVDWTHTEHQISHKCVRKFCRLELRRNTELGFLLYETAKIGKCILWMDFFVI